MSFDVFLQPSSQTPNSKEFGSIVAEVLKGLGAERLPPDGVNVRLSSGLEIELYDEGEPGAMVALRGFDTAASELLFGLAASTECFLIAPGVEAAFRMVGSKGEPPEDFLPVVLVDSPDMLAKQMFPGFQAWANYRDQVAAPPEPARPSLIRRLFGDGIVRKN
jgi:hypothetical protein